MGVYKKAALFLPVGAVGSWGIYHACTVNKTPDDVDFPKDFHTEEIINKDLDISEVFEDVAPIKHIQSESKDNVARDSSDDFWKTESLRDKFKGESDAIIDLIEKSRKADPVRYRYYHSKPKGREISLEQGKERVEIMRDYTMYVAGCRPWGTG